MKAKLAIKLLNENAVMPYRAHPNDAGMDISAAYASMIPSKGSAVISTGLAMALPEGYEAQIRGRSGLAFKHNIVAFPGTIDSNYRGEWMVLLFNHGEKPFPIYPGDRVAQMVINKYEEVIPYLTDSLDETDRGLMGFGSSGLGQK